MDAAAPTALHANTDSPNANKYPDANTTTNTNATNATNANTPNANVVLLPSSYPRGNDHGKRPWLSLHAAGLLALAGLIWSWVLQAEASQALQAKMQFSKPFFIVCFNHTATAVLLPLTVVYFKLFGTPRDRHETSWLAAPITVLHRHSVVPLPYLLRLALFLSLFYAVADYFWYAALTGVSVAAGTAIFNCSPLFVYCFSVCFLRERVSLAKVYGVLTAVAGVTLVLMYQDSDRLDLSALRGESVLAGALVVVSAALYGAYEVAFKAILGDEITDTATVVILTGLAGLLTVPIWLLGSLALAFSPFDALYEPLGWPTSTDGLALLVLSGALAVVFNVCMPLSLTWTSPLETSVGCMLTIPLSGVLDVVLHHTHFSVECMLGSALVMAGFGVLEYASKPSSTREDEDLLSQPEDERSLLSSRRPSRSSSTSARYTTL